MLGNLLSLRDLAVPCVPCTLVPLAVSGILSWTLSGWSWVWVREAASALIVAVAVAWRELVPLIILVIRFCLFVYIPDLLVCILYIIYVVYCTSYIVYITHL